MGHAGIPARVASSVEAHRRATIQAGTQAVTKPTPGQHPDPGALMPETDQSKNKIVALPRTKFGKGAARTHRRQHHIPAGL